MKIIAAAPTSPENARSIGHRIALGIASMLGLGMEANGLFMLINPVNWYFAVPGVTATGPFNQHFVRDIGLTSLLVGSAFLIGMAKPAWRTPLWGAAAIWLAGHALFHLWQVAVGICGPTSLAQDFPAVTLPALIALALTGWAMARPQSA